MEFGSIGFGQRMMRICRRVAPCRRGRTRQPPPKRERPAGPKLIPGRGLGSYDELPRRPSVGGQTLKLLFRVTAGRTIVGLRVGDVVVGTCNVLVGEQQRARGGSRTLSGN